MANHGLFEKKMEARIGFEPMDKGFADLCLTTWLPRRENQAAALMAAATKQITSALLLRLGFGGGLGGLHLALDLTNTTLPLGSCSKLLSHNGEACYQNHSRHVNVGEFGALSPPNHPIAGSGRKGVIAPGRGLPACRSPEPLEILGQFPHIHPLQHDSRGLITAPATDPHRHHIFLQKPGKR